MLSAPAQSDLYLPDVLFPRYSRKDEAKKLLLDAPQFVQLSLLLHPRWLREDPATVLFAGKLIAVLTEDDVGVEKLQQLPDVLGNMMDVIKSVIESTQSDPDSDRFCEPLEYVLEIVEKMTRDSVKPQEFLARADNLKLLLDYMEIYVEGETEFLESWKRCRSHMLRIIVSITSCDNNRDTLLDSTEFIERMRTWLGSSDKIVGETFASPELVACAALCLGNLARTEKNCVALVQSHQIAALTLSVLQKFEPTEGNRAQDPQVSAKVRHACIGLLKNLAIPPSNKLILGDLNAIELVAPFANSSIIPLQFVAVGLLKHPCNANANNATKMIQGSDSTPLRRVVEAVRKSNDPGIRGEGTRAIINMVKEGWRSISGNDPALIERKEQLRSALLAEDIDGPITEMTCDARYPVRQNEAIAALTIVSATQRDGSYQVLAAVLMVLNVAAPAQGGSSSGSNAEDAETGVSELAVSSLAKSNGSTANPTSPESSLVATLLEILTNTSTKFPEEMRLNVLSFLGVIFEASKGSSSSSSPMDRENDTSKDSFSASKSTNPAAISADQNAPPPPPSHAAPSTTFPTSASVVSTGPALSEPSSSSSTTFPSASSSSTPSPSVAAVVPSRSSSRNDLIKSPVKIQLDSAGRLRLAQTLARRFDPILSVLVDEHVTGEINRRLTAAARDVLTIRDTLQL